MQVRPLKTYRVFRKYPDEVMPVGQEQTILVRQAIQVVLHMAAHNHVLLPPDERSDGTI